MEITSEIIKGYVETTEKFTYCLDLLNLSLVMDGDAKCAVLVDGLEDEIEQAILEGVS